MFQTTNQIIHLRLCVDFAMDASEIVMRHTFTEMPQHDIAGDLFLRIQPSTSVATLMPMHGQTKGGPEIGNCL